MTLTCRLYRNGTLEAHDLDPERIRLVINEPGVLVWLDVDGPTEDTIGILGKEFGFHDLALEDSLQPHQRPKVQQYDSYFFLIAYGLTVKGDEVIEHEIAMFVGRNYLVTVRKEPLFDISAVIARWDAHSELTKEGGGYLLYIMLDEIVDGYFRAIDVLEDRSDGIEDQVFRRTEVSEAQTEIFKLKKELLRFRRVVSPLRDVLDVMQRRTLDVVTVPLEPYYRDVYDHILRAADFVEAIRDILSSVLEAQLSVVSNRLNEIMKSLTSWAAIILIPTLIAGIYGMNFAHMPELRWRFGYPFALGLMVTTSALLYRAFKKRGWL